MAVVVHMLSKELGTQVNGEGKRKVWANMQKRYVGPSKARKLGLIRYPVTSTQD